MPSSTFRYITKWQYTGILRLSQYNNGKSLGPLVRLPVSRVRWVYCVHWVVSVSHGSGYKIQTGRIIDPINSYDFKTRKSRSRFYRLNWLDGHNRLNPAKAGQARQTG